MLKVESLWMFYALNLKAAFSLVNGNKNKLNEKDLWKLWQMVKKITKLAALDFVYNKLWH